jgi:hypothetical protein
VRDDGTEAGVLEGRAGAVAREHVVGAAFVGGFAMGHAADDHEFVGDLGRILPEFTELDAFDIGIDGTEGPAVFGRGEGFRVEAFLVGHAAGKEDVDDAFRFSFDGVVVLEVGTRLHAEEVSKRKAESGAGTDVEKSAAGKGAGVAGSGVHGMIRRVRSFGKADMVRNKRGLGVFSRKNFLRVGVRRLACEWLGNQA